MVGGSIQTVAAIANDESLQVRLRKAHPLRGHLGTLRHTEVPTRGVSHLREMLCHCKLFCCVQGACETDETGPILAWYLPPLCQNWKCSNAGGRPCQNGVCLLDP